MEKNNFSIESPYFKHNDYYENQISLKNKEFSDELLKRRILTISKKVVGGEIRKFSEIASREISEEFSSLENRLYNDVSENISELIDNKINNFKIESERDLLEKVQKLDNNIETILEQKMSLLNTTIYNLEKKIGELQNNYKSLKEKLDSLIKEDTIIYRDYYENKTVFDFEKKDTDLYDEDYEFNLNN